MAGGRIIAPASLGRPRSVSERGHRCRRATKHLGTAGRCHPQPRQARPPIPAGPGRPAHLRPRNCPRPPRNCPRPGRRPPARAVRRWAPTSPGRASVRPGAASVRPRRPPANGKAARRARHVGLPSGAGVKLVVSAQGAGRAVCGREPLRAALSWVFFPNALPKRSSLLSPAVFSAPQGLSIPGLSQPQHAPAQASGFGHKVKFPRGPPCAPSASFPRQLITRGAVALSPNRGH